MSENNTEGTTATAKVEEPDTIGVPKNIDTSKPDTVTDPGVNTPEDDTPESDLEHWKRMSRKNENDFKKAAKERDSINAQLSEANMRIARLTAQREHPQITDEMFDKLCAADTPEGVEAWASAFAGLVPEQAKTEPEEQEEEAERPAEENKPVHIGSSMPEVQAAIRANQIGGGKMKGAVESEEDGREIARKFAEKRLERAHKGVASGK